MGFVDVVVVVAGLLLCETDRSRFFVVVVVLFFVFGGPILLTMFSRLVFLLFFSFLFFIFFSSLSRTISPRYGLAVEHTLKDLTVWNGNNGATYFYQSELPYIVNQAQFPNNSSGYHVTDQVTSHQGWGVGVYSYFKNHVVNVTSGIVTPSQGTKLVNPFTVFLNGFGGIDSIWNGKGGASVQNGPSQVNYLC